MFENIVTANEYNSNKLFPLVKYVSEVIKRGGGSRRSLNLKLERTPSCNFNVLTLGYPAHLARTPCSPVHRKTETSSTETGIVL
jgi:hypothetical protein